MKCEKCGDDAYGINHIDLYKVLLCNSCSRKLNRILLYKDSYIKMILNEYLLKYHINNNPINATSYVSIISQELIQCKKEVIKIIDNWLIDDKGAD